MDVSPIRQVVTEDIEGDRFGDVLKERLEDDRYSQFYFAIAFLRRSGFDYLGESLSEFLNQGGELFGVAGVDNKVTTREALEQLSAMATQSTIYNTSSDFIFHPKFYMLEGDDEAALIIGSGNLTRDGLFRNVEFGTIIEFNLSDENEVEKFAEYKSFLETLLDDAHPNVQPISENLLDLLEESGTLVTEDEAVGGEASTRGSGDPSENGVSEEVRELFPTQETPSLPTTSRVSADERETSGTTTSTSPEEWDTFVLQLSPFDSSHQPGTPGTPEVLIPMDAVDFFPEITEGPHKHPDVYFDGELETAGGSENVNYRFWYYDDRREWRLNVREATMEQVSPRGGSILVISKTDSSFRVRVVNQGDGDFQRFRDACTEEVGEKVWGFI
ncbi:phospholipase D-like domain-containing protein [Halorussus aquaticus]|uniref:Phospholipase D-like domain-containing protein n=1 Tax=Halorussus aquaticus TaxID=2953748 RepID=A0ABD5Q664_9EURY|nr:phospholipase D family protein [Halorussus aquaticus]